MSGDNNNNFFNLVSKVGEKIQNKVKNGEVNQGDLLSAQNDGQFKRPTKYR